MTISGKWQPSRRGRGGAAIDDDFHISRSDAVNLEAARIGEDGLVFQADEEDLDAGDGEQMEVVLGHGQAVRAGQRGAEAPSGLTTAQGAWYSCSMTIALSLPKDLEDFVERSVKSGRFSDEQELVCEALEMLKTREEFRQFQVAKLKQKLQDGLDDLETGRVAEWDGDEIKRKGRALLAAQMANA